MQADQRRHPRRPLQVLLRGRDAEGVGNLVFEASDLSGGGVFLASDFLHDEQPLVRRNAALALVRFNDNSGRAELIATLKPYVLKAPADGRWRRGI